MKRLLYIAISVIVASSMQAYGNKYEARMLATDTNRFIGNSPSIPSSEHKDSKLKSSTNASYSINCRDYSTGNGSNFIDVSIICNVSLVACTGFDIVLQYDNSKVIATDSIILGNDLLKSSYAGYTLNSKSGKINLSLYLNGNGGIQSFNGTGTVVTFRLSKTPTILPDDSLIFLATLLESYDTSTKMQQVSSAIYKPAVDLNFTGTLSFWADNSPIVYDTIHPTAHQITTISSANKTTMPDLNGEFSFKNPSNYLIINKDIDSNTDVMPVINGYDAFLTAIVAAEDPSFVPTVYQIIAMDVNRDGVISAGDVSQINERTLKSITRFTHSDDITLDWLFVDKEAIVTDPKYQISSLYPFPDGKGYSKTMVPTVPPVINIQSSNGKIENNKTFIAILVGDVNGNYKNISATNTANFSSLKDDIVSTNDSKVLFDYKNANLTTIDGIQNVDVPVIINSDLGINAFDFSLQYNSTFLQYVATNVIPAINSNVYFNANDKTFRFTSYSKLGAYDVNKTIVTIRFKMLGNMLLNRTLFNTKAYINGDLVSSEVSINNNQDSTSHTVEIYPNPSTDVMKIVVKKTSRIEIFNDNLQKFYTIESADANQINSIDLQGLTRGIYYIKVSNDNSTTSKVFIKE